MTRALRIRFIFVPALLAVGCATPADPEPLAVRTVASPGLVIQLDPELDQVLRDYETAWRAGDASALAALFGRDGFLLQPGQPPIRGRVEIERAYAGQGGAPLRLRAIAHRVEGSMAWIVGVYGYGEDPDEVGKFTLILQRGSGGRWQIVSDMDNLSR